MLRGTCSVTVIYGTCYMMLYDAEFIRIQMFTAKSRLQLVYLPISRSMLTYTSLSSI